MFKKRTNKIISVILSIALIMSMCVVAVSSVSAATDNEPVPPDNKLLGDVDGDGALTVSDATTIQSYLAELISENDLDLSVADYTKDGVIDVRDATYIQLVLAELVPTEPVTTEPETTEEPTTEEPTTAEPTTEEPTTEPEVKYYIAGDAGLVGVQWDPAGVALTKGEYTYDGAAYDY
ncbi:MAG: dockerin type I repeat-containing protein, partial [Ruminococcus sp.]